MQRARLLSAFLYLASTSTMLYADDISTAWRKVLRNCASAETIGKNLLFFGVSNTIGPGSVWRFADDKSLRLLFELSDAIPNETERQKLIVSNNVVACSGTAAYKWNIKLGIPFASAAVPLSGDLAAALSRAHKINVSLTGFSVDELKEANWEAAFKELPETSPYVSELSQPGRVIAENVVKVTGLKITFSFGSELSADVQAMFKGKTLTLGKTGSDSAVPGAAKDQPAKSAEGGTTSKTQSKPSVHAATGGTPTSGAGSNSPKDSGHEASQSCNSQQLSAESSGSGSSPESDASKGLVTLHSDLSSKTDIVVCADGPFYLLAGYSRLSSSGGIIGAAPVGPRLLPVELPPDAHVTSSDR